MFEDIKQEKILKESENRHRTYSKEDMLLSEASNPMTDQAFKEEQDSRADLLRWQQNLDDELFQLIMVLKGFEQVEDGWIRVKESPLCNDKFIHDVVIPQCRPLLSRNLINSNLSEARILDILKNTSNDIADAIADGYEYYSISFENYNLVVRTIKNTISPTAFRAIGGWTKRIDSTTNRRVESFTDGSQNQPKKILGLFG